MVGYGFRSCEPVNPPRAYAAVAFQPEPRCVRIPRSATGPFGLVALWWMGACGSGLLVRALGFVLVKFYARLGLGSAKLTKQSEQTNGLIFNLFR